MAAYDLIWWYDGGSWHASLGLNPPGLWTAVSAGAGNGISNVGGRGDGFAAGGGNFTQNVLRKNFTTAYASWIAGMAHIWGTPTSGNTLLALYDTASVQCDLRVNALGQLFFTRNGTQIGGLSASAVPNGAGWTYIELKATVASGTGGSLEASINGVVWLTVTGVNTQATANPNANGIAFGGAAGGSFIRDLYIMPDTGSGPYSTYLGDILVGAQYLNAAGPDQAWSLGAGASQLAAVQDGISLSGTRPDDDTGYIYSGTAGQISDFSPQALVLPSGSIYGVMHITYARKDDAGSRAIRQICKSGATTEDNGSDISLGNSYVYYFDRMLKDPNGPVAWTVTNLNNALFGVKEIT